MVGGAGLAGKGDDIDQGAVQLFLGRGALRHALGQPLVGISRPHPQAHGQTDALADDGPLLEDAVTVLGHLPWYDAVGAFVEIMVVFR